MTITTPHIEEFKVGDLQVDPAVQRALDRLRAAKMAAEFKSSALGVLAVSHRPSGLYVVDGQHRYEAARISAYAGPINANVYDGLSIADEAELFLTLNATNKPGAIDTFRLRLARGDMDALACARILEHNGWKLVQGAGVGNFSAITSLVSMYALDPKGDKAAVAVALEIISETWNHASGTADGRLLSGLSKLVIRNGDNLDRGVMVKKLATFPGGADGVIGTSRGLAAVSRRSVSDAVAAVMAEAYNAYRRTGQLAPWA